jgi:hypothetical protein
MPVEEFVDLPGLPGEVGLNQGEGHGARVILNHLGEHRLPADLDPLVEYLAEAEHVPVELHGGVELSGRQADRHVVDDSEQAVVARRGAHLDAPRRELIGWPGTLDQLVGHIAEAGHDGGAHPGAFAGRERGRRDRHCASRDDLAVRGEHVVGAEPDRGDPVAVPPDVAGGRVACCQAGGEQDLDLPMAEQ